MKRVISIILTCALALALASCGRTEDLIFSGAFWNENPENTSVYAITEETALYGVSSVLTSEFYSEGLSAEGLELSIDEENSSYETKLTVGEDGNYVLETTLKINGKYKFDGGEYPVENDLTYTKTVFKGIEENLFPISSYQKAENTCAQKASPTDNEDFYKVRYEAEITYGDEAKVTITPSEESERYFSSTKYSEKDYKKITFLDGNEMIFAFRAVKYESGKSYYFGTLDFLSGEYKEIKAEGINTASEGSEQAKTPITVKQYRENGKFSDEKQFNCIGLKFSTTGSYGKTFRYVYYATNPTGADGKEINSTRRIPVRIYQPLTYNKGYLRFTLQTYKWN